jgi:Holliday junction resolvase RusA-like endonuclease
MNVSFTVRGVPVPQGSKRALVHRSTGRAVVIEQGGQRHKDWRQDVKAAAREAMGPVVTQITMANTMGRFSGMLTGPVGVSICFTVPKPKSAPKTRRTWPDKRPDLDKLVRAVLDAITGEVIADDAQVVQLLASKVYPGEDTPGDVVKGLGLDWPGAAIHVYQISEGMELTPAIVKAGMDAMWNETRMPRGLARDA